MAIDFLVVLRGYDRFAVDKLFTQAQDAVSSGSQLARTAARDALTGAEFGASLRGYDRAQVDLAVKIMADVLTRIP
ncbi:MULTISPECIES: hypothetical protein [Actinoplanes]|uniref:DivIVA domain-containing protein n=2 Tax=Actinoplanes TaxID=1865 RepID=A0A0X3V8U8_9ACTN|nr:MULTISPECIES: hypothetical protein [Actinoplanes]KUL41211.1 hypothetical protein ADL15_05270 [Actinoplanes awajinensis subsp. mycoplanecinus]GIE73524.1 hypothetical protein Apa02nite_096320 [Actinoplanes palleronii]